MVRLETKEEAAKLLRNAALALAIMPLLDNIDESLGREWNDETFEATDRAFDKFVDDLNGYGFLLVPTTSPEGVLSLVERGQAEATAKLDNLPVQ